MYTRLGDELLKTGERMEAGVVLGPDAEWLPRMVPFLGHKNPEYRAHIRGALEGPLDDLRTRFYVGTVEGEVISQIMVVGDRGAGILAHVYTHPDHRRKGACSRVMQHQMQDCRRAGFRVICLGTGYDSAPYWIYHSFGFRSIAPESGRMKWVAAPGAEEELFRPGPAAVREAGWGDWGYFDLLGFQPVQLGEELPRSPVLGAKGQDSLEGRYVAFQARRGRESQIQARVLVSESGATVGWAFLAPDTHWYRDVWLVDLYTHPNFEDRLPNLAAALEWPDAPVAAYLTSPEGAKATALAAAGFRRISTLPEWLAWDGARKDLGVWLR